MTDGRRAYDVHSPVTGEFVTSAVDARSADVDDAVRTAATAFDTHRQESAFARATWCQRIADVIESRIDTMGPLLSLEHGKPLAQAHSELGLAASGFRLAAEEAKRLHGETIPTEDPRKLVITTRKPRGVFAAITPFNFPVNIPVEYLGPLLACGNAVVWRPAPTTAGIAQALFDCVEAADLPPGLVTVVTGVDVEPARHLVSHPDTVGVCFTGSSTTGDQVARAAAGKTQLMELGGNGPTVVLADADLERAAAAIAQSAFWNSGQSCSAAGRVVAAASIADELAERLAALAAREVVGSPFESATTMGPVHTAGVAATMEAHIQDSVERGSGVAHGGDRVSDMPTDLYWQPTVLTDVAPDAAVMHEETFGPLAPIAPVTGDLDDLVAAANAGRYGLSAAVFGRDLDRTLSVAGRLRAGQVTVNDTSNYWELHLPFGGAPGRASGQGRLGGRYAAETVTEVQSISVHLPLDWR